MVIIGLIVLLAIMNQIKWMSVYDPIILAIRGGKCALKNQEKYQNLPSDVFLYISSATEWELVLMHY